MRLKYFDVEIKCWDLSKVENFWIFFPIKSLYELYLNKWTTITVYIIICVHLVLLPLLEHPAYFEDIAFWIPCTLEIVCLLAYLTRWFHLKSFQTKEEFYSDKKHIVVLVVIFVRLKCWISRSFSLSQYLIYSNKLTLLDLTVYICLKTIDMQFAYRYTRALRVLFYINFNEVTIRQSSEISINQPEDLLQANICIHVLKGKELRRAFRNVRRTLPGTFDFLMANFKDIIKCYKALERNFENLISKPSNIVF